MFAVFSGIVWSMGFQNLSENHENGITELGAGTDGVVFIETVCFMGIRKRLKKSENHIAELGAETDGVAFPEPACLCDSRNVGKTKTLTQQNQVQSSKLCFSENPDALWDLEK